MDVAVQQSDASPAALRPEQAPIQRTVVWLFGGTIFLSAFLVFLVQPLIGKYVLPWFGGSTGVWTTCLLFFQVMLLGGYAYAHVLSSRLSQRAQVGVHLAILLVALAFLPIIPADRWKSVSGAWPTLALMGLLAVTLGVPYLVLSATSPLLQAWYVRAHRGGSPYRFYAVSNAGSLLALVAYPLLLEPTLSRYAQATAWSAGLAGFAVLCAACGAVAWRIRPAEADGAPSSAGDGLPVRPSRFAWIGWLIYPMCSAALLLAMTNRMCQDIAVIPLLWVLPLALYLLSFILCFDHPRWYRQGLFAILWFAALGGMFCLMFLDLARWPIALQVGICAAAMWLGCMICHGELARQKPSPAHLTQYYLWIAAGGAAGGAFVALAAPMLFNRYHELHVALFVTTLLLTLRLWRDPTSPLRRGRPAVVWVLLITLVQAVGAVLWLDSGSHLAGTQVLAHYRSFYGVLTVCEVHDQGSSYPLRMLMHATTTHGMQFVDSEARRIPISYYGPKSGVAMAIDLLPADRSWHLGVIGLGTGTLAAYGRAGDVISFYEINPQVKAIAMSDFYFLRDTPAEVRVHIGDARLVLEAQSSQEFDLLALDAFSGDAIPAHLLTREAFELYLQHLAVRGFLVVHVSNQYLDLAPVVNRLAATLNLGAYLVQSADSFDNPETSEYAATWIILWRKADWPQMPLAASEPPVDGPLWTDERSDLLRILR